MLAFAGRVWIDCRSIAVGCGGLAVIEKKDAGLKPGATQDYMGASAGELQELRKLSLPQRL
jgi:hypothetical protein